MSKELSDMFALLQICQAVCVFIKWFLGIIIRVRAALLPLLFPDLVKTPRLKFSLRHWGLIWSDLINTGLTNLNLCHLKHFKNMFYKLMNPLTGNGRHRPHIDIPSILNITTLTTLLLYFCAKLKIIPGWWFCFLFALNQKHQYILCLVYTPGHSGSCQVDL